MRSAKCWRCLLILVILQALSGCSYIRGLFPDKERDYQFRTEVPDLLIPDDLKPQATANSRMTGLMPVNPPKAPDSPAIPVQTATVVKESIPAKPKQTASTTAVETSEPVQVEVTSAAVSSLQIDQAKIPAWRLVARALSRQRIEIVERNLDNAYFYVKYDPDAIKPEDNSFWDEMAFLFGEDPSHEQQYRISLLEITPQSTEVTVQNSEGKTVSNSPATRLLKLIADGINLDTPAGSEATEKAVP
ncbi:outer membrane protein assembly factor BamC [Methylomonas sp. AM2-LC]|uniref:outer membrane protein assembly factor BamC n=1 Tax=Methylomonas sp. AM2-LC TaxID=3153301 RepID=UPI003263E76E